MRIFRQFFSHELEIIMDTPLLLLPWMETFRLLQSDNFFEKIILNKLIKFKNIALKET